MGRQNRGFGKLRDDEFLECCATRLGYVQKVYGAVRLIYRNGTGKLFCMISLWTDVNHSELAIFMRGIHKLDHNRYPGRAR